MVALVSEILAKRHILVRKSALRAELFMTASEVCGYCRVAWDFRDWEFVALARTTHVEQLRDSIFARARSPCFHMYLKDQVGEAWEAVVQTASTRPSYAWGKSTLSGTADGK